MRVLLLGGSGTIGAASARALVARGHEVVALVRPGRGGGLPPGTVVREGEPCAPGGVARDGLRGERFDAVLSCLASRSGVAADAWAVDDAAQRHALAAACAAGVPRFVLLSAICVQRPRLAFQHAKLAAESALRASDRAWTIVRPTAYFKSLSGQFERVRQGRPFVVLGDGRRNACRPISDRDLATFLADTLADPSRIGRVLPIGGPGLALTPLDQGRLLCEALGRPPAFRHVPPALLAGVAAGLGFGARLLPRLAPAAELARIGRYYASESMLVWDEARGAYDADATPATGRDTLAAHYAALAAGAAPPLRGAHAVF